MVLWSILAATIVVIVSMIMAESGAWPDPAPSAEERERADSIRKAERPAALRTTAWRWREDSDAVGDRGAIMHGGVASTITTSREAGGLWQDRRLSLTCGWEGTNGAGPMYSVNFHYPGAKAIPASAGRGHTSMALSVDGEPLPHGRKNTFGGGNAYTHDGYASAYLPMSTRAALMAGDTVRVEHVALGGRVFGVGTFALDESATALSDAGLGACSWAKAERLRAKADRAAAERRAAAEARRKRENNPCTSGARFEKLPFGIGWHYQPRPGADWAPVRMLFPNDYNKIIRQLEWLGAGDPVLYKDIPGLC